MNRFITRYGGSAPSARTCSTPGCDRQARTLGGLCHRCANNARRYSDPLQKFPTPAELNPYVYRMERQRARHRHLMVDVLEARWNEVIDDCRGRAAPTFANTRRLSYNKHEAAGAALVRDIGENVAFTRALDLMGALQLMQIERGYFRTEAAFHCCLIEALRREAGIGTIKLARKDRDGVHSYRKALAKEVRLAAARFVHVGMGAAALALAKRESEREQQSKTIRTSYYTAVETIEAAAE